MKKQGASMVAVLALLVIIVACVGFVVYWVMQSGEPRAVGADIEKRYVCAAPGCGFTKDMMTLSASKLQPGPAFDGGGEELHKCPKCGKFSFDTLSKCPKCQKEFVDTGKGCPNCGKAE